MLQQFLNPFINLRCAGEYIGISEEGKAGAVPVGDLSACLFDDQGTGSVIPRF